MSSFPGAIYSPPTRTDSVDQVVAADFNNPAGEIVAIENTLGINPQGSAATVAARVAAIESSSGAPLTPTTLNATYGDHFTGSSLAGKWTRNTYVSGDEAYQQGGGSWMTVAPRATTAYYVQTVSGLASTFSIVTRMVVTAQSGAYAWGVFASDASGNGAAASIYASSTTIDGCLTLQLASFAYSGTFTQSVAVGGGTVAHGGVPFWLKLTCASGVYTARHSLNGMFWSDPTGNYTPTAFTPVRVGFGSLQGTVKTAAIDFFDIQ